MNASDSRVPVQDKDSELYWAGLASHELRGQQCTACGETRIPPLVSCPACGHAGWRLVLLTGRGRIYSWIVVRRAMGAITKDELPVIIATVELREGCRMVGRLRTCRAPHIDQPVVADFIDRDGWTELAFLES
jgi:uncharacterized OB-fold protein